MSPIEVSARTVRNLTDEQMRRAFENVGVDLACGACMCAFFTGSNGYPHTCEKREEVSVVFTDIDDELVMPCDECEKPTSEGAGARSIADEDGKYLWLCWDCRVGR